MIRTLLTAAILLTAIATMVRADVLQTADGRIIEGVITFANDLILIQPPIGAAERVDPAEALGLHLDIASHDTATRGALPPPWSSRDIGKVGLNGRAAHHHGTFHISGAGADIWGNEDAFHFLHQPVSGSIDITAHVLSIQNTHPHAKAGIMIRDRLDPHARYVMLLVKPTGEIALEYRHDGLSQVGRRERVNLPVAMRLQKRNDHWQAQFSEDGKQWQTLDTLQMPLHANHGGLIVLSHDTTRLCTARFDQVELRGGGGPLEHPSAPPRDRVMLPSGIEMRDGRIITGDVRDISEDAVHLSRADDTELRVELSSIARVMIEPMTQRMAQRLLDDRSGVLTDTGDFIEGDITILPNKQIRVNSILYGLQTIPRDRAAMLVLAQPKDAGAPVVVRTMDGSVWLADRLRVRGDRLIVEDEQAGELQLEARRIRSVEATAGRTTSLLTIQPTVDNQDIAIGQPMAIGQSVTGYPLGLRGRLVERGLSSAGGVKVSFTLDRAYRALICTAGVAADQSPQLRGQLVVLGDGKELYRSRPVTSADPPSRVGVSLKGVKTVTLLIQPTDDSPLAPAAAWADPQLVIE